MAASHLTALAAATKVVPGAIERWCSAEMTHRIAQMRAAVETDLPDAAPRFERLLMGAQLFHLDGDWSKWIAEDVLLLAMGEIIDALPILASPTRRILNNSEIHYLEALTDLTEIGLLVAGAEVRHATRRVLQRWFDLELDRAVTNMVVRRVTHAGAVLDMDRQPAPLESAA